MNEYKYGSDKVVRSFPAGHLNVNEDPADAAKRELLEETGYGNGTFEYIGVIREFATKIISKGYVVRASHVEKITPQNLDINENVEVVPITKDQLQSELDAHEWEGAKEIAAITLTKLLNA